MNKMEYRINAKIIKQLSLFLMLHGVKDFNIEYHLQAERVVFVITVQELKSEFIERMKEKVGGQREIEVETYGWELMGDTDSQNELDILGSLIDEIDIQEVNNHHQITLTRQHQTKFGK